MDLYHRPANAFVAGFIGAPAMNFLTVTLTGGTAMHGSETVGAAPAGTTQLGIRPEHLILLPAGQGAMQASVTLRETLGGDAYLYVRTAAGQQMVVRADGDTRLDHGAMVGLDLPAARLHHFAADGQSLTGAAA